MYRLATLALVAACGTSPDSRPVTADVIVLEILAPTCGQVQCHSTTTNTKNYAFDTLEAGLKSLKDVSEGGDRSELVRVLHATGGDRMPPDYPLDSQDLDLIQKWIDAGRPGV